MTDSKNLWERSICIPAPVEFLSINYSIIQKSCKSNAMHNYLYKSCDSLAKEGKCLQTGIPSSLDRAMYAEIQFKMDGSQVEWKPLRSRSSVSKTEMNDADFNYVTERNSLSKTCTLHIEPVKASSNDCTNDSTGCTCKLMELPITCGNKTGQQLNTAATPKLNAACSDHSFSCGDITGRTLSKPFLSHFGNCHESYEDEVVKDFYQRKKERSTLLSRRFCKNDKQVKKSVYTGTRAIVRTLPSGHIGVVAWKYVDQRNHNDLTHNRITTEQLMSFQVSISEALSSYFLQSIWHGVSMSFFLFYDASLNLVTVTSELYLITMCLKYISWSGIWPHAQKGVVSDMGVLSLSVVLEDLLIRQS